MPRKKNLDLAEAIHGEEIDVTEDEANEANTIVAVEPPAPVVAPAPQMAVTMADISSIVKAAVEAAQSGNSEMARMVTDGIAQARKPIPEGTDASNPRISAQNPLGDRDHPRPELKCAITLGTQEGKGKPIQRTYPFDDGDLTVQEILALNTLQPGNFVMRLYGGAEIKVSVVPEYDPASDELRRLVIVLPQHVTQRGSQLKNMLPGAVDIVAQLTGHDFSKLSTDDLAWFMAQHRQKNYVAVRESVAA